MFRGACMNRVRYPAVAGLLSATLSKKLKALYTGTSYHCSLMLGCRCKLADARRFETTQRGTARVRVLATYPLGLRIASDQSLRLETRCRCISGTSCLCLERIRAASALASNYETETTTQGWWLSTVRPAVSRGTLNLTILLVSSQRSPPY